METAVGIQLQHDKAIIAVVKKKGLVLQALHTIYASNTTELQDELKRIFTKEKIPKYNITLSVPVQHSILRKFSVAFTNKQQIDDIIFYETENHIFSQDIEKFIVDYCVLQTENNKTKLSVAAVPIQIIEQQLEIASNCGIHPFIVDIDAFSLFYFFQLFSDYAAQNTILLYLEETHAHFLVIKEGKVTDIRKLIMRTSWLTDEDDTSSMGATTELLIKDIENDKKHIDVDKYTKRIVKELHTAFLTNHSIDKIYISGDNALVDIVNKTISGEFQIDCSSLDIQKHFTILPKVTYDSRSVIAIGLALRSLGIAKDGFNFRKGQFSYKNNFSLLKKPLAIFFTCILIILLLANIFYTYQIHFAKKRYENLLNNAKSIHKRNFSTKIKSNYWNQIASIRKNMQQQIEQPQIPTTLNIDIVWAELSEILDKVRRRHYIVVDKVNLNQSDITFSGRTNDDTCLDLVRNFLLAKSWVDKRSNGQKVLDTTKIREPKNPKLTISYRYLVKIKKAKKKKDN